MDETTKAFQEVLRIAKEFGKAIESLDKRVKALENPKK